VLNNKQRATIVELYSKQPLVAVSLANKDNKLVSCFAAIDKAKDKKAATETIIDELNTRQGGTRKETEERLDYFNVPTEKTVLEFITDYLSEIEQEDGKKDVTVYFVRKFADNKVSVGLSQRK
jgi:hypothetical protein